MYISLFSAVSICIVLYLAPVEKVTYFYVDSSSFVPHTVLPCSGFFALMLAHI